MTVPKDLLLHLIRPEEFRRVEAMALPLNERLRIVADMCRANALAAVKRAGSGHLGSSFSSMDIVVRLYYHELNVRRVGVADPNRDIYFSSKGHDVPALYAVLYSLGIIEEEKFLMLRRFGGLEGHPDVSTPGIEANSGSLGMGISKARGMSWAKRRSGQGGRVFVMTGDGEWQEGQNYEALQGALQAGITNLTVVVDHNKVQSDKLIHHIVDLRDLTAKIAAFGWRVVRCDGNDQEQLERGLIDAAQGGGPVVVIADTIKGAGVSFMEHPGAMNRPGGTGLYPWHAGAPKDDDYRAAYDEILGRVNARLVAAGQAPAALTQVPPVAPHNPVYTLEGEPVSLAMPVGAVSKGTSESVADVYGQTLLKAMERRPDLIVLDADLAADCRVRAIEERFPERFIECGIAEQDMVSTAGGLARLGLLPVVNSFASFLASRANEQIYNNASEKTRIIYALHYAGVIPAGPGKSHQSIRDISLLAALPNMVILQPCCAQETAMIVDYAVDEARENVALRLVIGPSPRRIALPEGYRLEPGRGCILAEGNAATIVAYGPVLLHEALLAGELLAKRGTSVRVVNMPWLNVVDREWLAATLLPGKAVLIVEDHAPTGGLADRIVAALTADGRRLEYPVHRAGVEGYPAFGTPPEALKFHGLDATGLAEKILRFL